MKIAQFRRRLAAMGARFVEGAKHTKVYLNGMQTTLPRHLAAIERQTRRPMMLSYPARIARDGDGFMVSFPDIPEALTGAATKDGALEMAADALVTAMDFYFEDRRAVPGPSAPKRGQVLIDLPPSVGAKVLLLNEMLAQGARPVDLARLMKLRPQEVSRLTDLRHPTKIDTIAQALKSLGKRLDLSLT